jgi:hypothetical protein
MTKKVLPFLLIVLCLSSKAYAIEGGYKDGFYLQSEEGDFRLNINFHLQLQHQFLSVEGQGKTNSFQIRRGRIFFSGNAFTKKLAYLFHFEFIGGRTNNASEGFAYTGPNLLDAYVDYEVIPAFAVKGGQFKVPYNLEELISDLKGQFIDRPITNDVFTFNRDLGVAFHGRPWGKVFDYTIYAMNEGTNRNASNKNNEMLFGGRFVLNVLGDHGYTSGDPEETEEPQLMLGTAANFNRVGSAAGGAADQSVISATGDAAFRYKGFSTIGAGYYLRNQTASTNIFGFHSQAGYFVIPHHLEVVGRFCGVIPTSVGVTNGYEAGGGLGYYFKGHKLKLMTDYAILINSPLVIGVGGASGTNAPTNSATTGGAPGFVQNQNDHRVRTQFQMVF